MVRDLQDSLHALHVHNYVAAREGEGIAHDLRFAARLV